MTLSFGYTGEIAVRSGIRCRYCQKLLPEGHSTGVCPLCASGLLPPKERKFTRDEDPPIIVQGRELSGVDCPCGRAELTWNDLERGICPACGLRFSAEELTRLRRHAGHSPRFDQRRY
jgi:hypothetical protein